MSLFKTRGFFEKLTRPATEEERRGERNAAIVGCIMLLAIVGIFLYGCWSLIKLVIS